MVSRDFLLFQNELGKDEVLLWSGRPRQGVRLRAIDAYLIPFSLLWVGFTLFGELLVISTGIIFFALWGVPFILIGFYMMIGRFIVDAYMRSRTYYGLTNQRAIIVSGLLQREIKSLNLRTASDITLNQKRSGRGSIVFGTMPVYARMHYGAYTGMFRNMPPQFEMIPDARRVYDMILDTQR